MVRRTVLVGDSVKFHTIFEAVVCRTVLVGDSVKPHTILETGVAIRAQPRLQIADVATRVCRATLIEIASHSLCAGRSA